MDHVYVYQAECPIELVFVVHGNLVIGGEVGDPALIIKTFTYMYIIIS